MRALALLAVILVASPALADRPAPAKPAKAAKPAKKKAASLTLRSAPPPAVGDTVTVVDRVTVDATLDAAQLGKTPFQSRTDATYTLEILAVDGDLVRRARVRYGAVATTNTFSGHASTDPDARAGQEYVIEVGSSGIRFLDAAGKEVTGPVLDQLRSEHGKLARGLPMRRWLLGRTFRKGKAVALGADDFEDLFGAVDQQLTVHSFDVTLRALAGDVARFEFVARFVMADAQAGSTLTLDARGGFEVDTRRVLPVSRTLDGMMTGTVATGGDAMTMAGTLSGESRYTYGP